MLKYKYKFETNKEILAAFRKIKNFIKDEKNVSDYGDYIGKTILAQKIWCAFAKLFEIRTVTVVGIIIEKFYNIKISYLRNDDWEDKLINLYDICNNKRLGIE